MLELPKQEKSFWREFSKGIIYPELKEDISVDTVIIGAGITGLSTAYFLKNAGQKVAVLEKQTVGAGTTGRTTGKVTAQHDLIYDSLVARHGLHKARLYAAANQSAVAQIEKIIKDNKIECDWSRVDHFVYTTRPDDIKKYKAEARVAARLGLPANFVTKTPLPFKVTAAVRFQKQGKFNSQKYLQGLSRAVDGGGSFVFENSKAIHINGGRHPNVKTKHATVHCKDIVVATHVPTFPLAGRVGYGFLEYPTESFIVAGQLPKKLSGTYISPDDENYSIFPLDTDKGRVLLIGGEGGNVPGIRLSKAKRYQKLANYAKDRFGIESITHKWSDMDYRGYDGLPIIGRLYPWSSHLYVGTGYMKWGMTNGTVAAMILRNMILGDDNPWLPAFDSTRSTTLKSMPKTLVKQIFS